MISSRAPFRRVFLLTFFRGFSRTRNQKFRSILHTILIESELGMGGAVAQAAKRIPRIKFPQRLSKSPPSSGGSGSHAGDADLTFFSGAKAPSALGGRASDQPKRTPVSKDEIEAIMLGGCL